MGANTREATCRVCRHRARHKSRLCSDGAQTMKQDIRKPRRRTRLKASDAMQTHDTSRPTLPPRSHRCNSLAISVIISYCLLELTCKLALPHGLSLLTSADELPPSQSIEPQPEAQPLIFMLPELGSGEGSRRAHSRTSTSFSIDASSTDADMAPALIEARCWNNYENDNDCKQLNVISAPQGENQNSQQLDDSIITPVVIFEASSSVEPPLDNQVDPERPVFMAPPYQSNDIPQRHHTANTKMHKQHPERQQTSTSSYAATSRDFEPNFDPPTLPSVVAHVVTPQPADPSNRPKSTTPGRKCRDENDDDCDEDEDNPIRGPANGNDENEDDDGDEDEGQDSNGRDRTSPGKVDSSDGQSNLIGEPGSGLGPGGGQTDDDTDDSKDDGDADSTGETGESSGASSIQENATNQSPDGGLLVITSSYPPQQMIDSTLKPDSGADTQQAAAMTTSRPVTRRPQGGAAEIEVVVHSTLPPSFPGQGLSGGRPKGNHEVHLNNFETQSSTTTTTMIPTEEIVTSRPTFPSTTVDNSPTLPPENPDSEQFTSATRTNQTVPTTTEADLFTFKPIPIPFESETRPPRFDPMDSKQDVSSGGPARPGIGPQHIHEPLDRRPFDFGWTTRKPQSSMPSLAGSNSAGNPSDLLASGRMQPKSKPIYMPTETLPTMLLYASIIVTVFISLILVVIYSLWRRNSLRRRALLAKAHLMNGRTPAGMIESMSHVSHLMHGPDGMPPQQPPQQGLLSTYAPTKGSAMGKVTTSLVKPIGQSESGLLNQELDEDEDGDDADTRQVYKESSKDELANGVEDSSLDEAQNQPRSSRLTNGINEPMQNRSGSWSTEDPTTTTSSGSQRTQDSQVNLQQRQHGQPMQNSPNSRHPYPNSLSDGRQNSSSISDSQCSPDPQPSASLAMGPVQHPQQPLGPGPNQPPHMLSPMHGNNQQMMASPVHLVRHHLQPYELHQRHQLQQQPHHIRPILRMPLANGLPRMGTGPSLMSPVGPQPHPMMVQNNGQMDGLKHRLVTSRSIEDIPPSQHVGFINQPTNNQQYLPYNQHQQVGPPQLIRGKPLYQHPDANVAVNFSPTFRNPLISSQRIAMSPLATLSRRVPPGAGLNRNVYSEDSSSFMTASPSLARTSSSSSFAFNLSNLPTPSSIKARHIVDNSGRVFNDYTQGLADHANGTETSAVTTGPHVFAPSERNEPWYV